MSILTFTRLIVVTTLAAGTLLLCTSAGAAAAPLNPTAETSTTPALANDSQGPQFYSDAFVDVTGSVDGDVYAAGQSVTISGDVTGDVIAAAQTIIISGTVDGDVRLAGQQVTISGQVSRSGTIFAQSMAVASTGSFGADLIGAAGDVRVAGEVGRDIVLSVGDLSIDGTVGGTVTYVSGNEARLADGAVDGAVERIQPPQSSRIEVSPWAVLASWLLGLLYALVALSLITLLSGWLVPRWLERVTDQLVPSPWRALLVGFVACVAVPLALLLLLLTIVGAPLALAGMLVWFGLTLATFVHGSYYIGRIILRGRSHPVVTSLVGGVILIVGLQIPWLNILVWLAMVFFGVGAQLLELRRLRPWAMTSDTGRVPANRPPVDMVSPQEAPQA